MCLFLLGVSPRTLYMGSGSSPEMEIPLGKTPELAALTSICHSHQNLFPQTKQLDFSLGRPVHRPISRCACVCKCTLECVKVSAPPRDRLASRDSLLNLGGRTHSAQRLYSLEQSRNAVSDCWQRLPAA